MHAPLKPLHQRDLDVLTRLAAAGEGGMSAGDLLTLLDHAATRDAVKDFLQRVRRRGHRIAASRVGYDGRTHLHRYVLADAPAAAPAGLRSVLRTVSGDLGLGATPGARVSVAYVSFIDGAAA